jgi:tape measure domain-containing protein
MSDFQSKIIEVKKLVEEVNDLFKTQIEVLDSLNASIKKYGTSAKGVPSDFSKAQNDIKAQAEEQIKIEKAKLAMIASLNKQRYQEEEKLRNDAEKAMLHGNQEEIKQIKARQAMIASLGKQRKQEEEQIKKEALANEHLSRAYVQLTGKRNEAKNKLQDLIASEKASTSEIKKAQKEFDILNKKVAQADNAIGKLSQANGGLKNLTSSVSSLMGAFGIATGLFLAVDIAKNIYETTKQLQSLDLALKMVSGTQEEFASNQAFISGVAEKWGIEIKGLTEQYTQFYTASKGILSTAKIKEVFESIAKSGALMGLSVEKQNNAFYAFEQMMSKGVVSSEELKKQLGNAMPGAMKAAGMAYMELHPKIKSIQEAEGALMKEMKKGAIDSATYVPLIVKNLEKLYGIEMVDKVETLQASQERFMNSWTNLVRHMNESPTSGLGSFFNFLMDGLTNATKALDKFLSSWDTIQKEAKISGTAEGSKMFKQAIAGKDAEEAKAEALYQQVQAREILLGLLKEEEKVVKKVTEWRKLGGTTVGSEASEEELRKLKYNIGIYASILRESKTFLQPVAVVKAGGGTSEKETDEEKKARLAREKAQEDMLKAIYEANKKEIELKIAKNEVILNNENSSFEQQQKALEENLAYRMMLLKMDYNEQVRLAKGNDAKIKSANYDFQIAVIKQTEDFNKKLKEIREKDRKERADEIKDVQKDQDTANESAKTQEEEKTKIIVAGFNAIDEAEEKRLKKQKEIQKARIKLFNEYIGEFAYKSGFGQSFDFFTELDKNGKTMWEKLIEDAKDGKMEFEDVFMGITTIAQDSFNLISGASEQHFAREYARLEKQHDDAIEFAGDSDSAKKQIEKDYEKRRKEIEKREFESKQHQASVNIAIDTAQAIMQIWAHSPDPTGISQGIMTGIIATLGLAQIGIVEGKKFQEYYTGTDNAQEGLAYTQERGAEIITDKKGNIKDFGDNRGARLTKMSAGDKVFTAEQTKRLMFQNDYHELLSSNGILEPKIVIDNGITYQQMDEVLGKHFGNMEDKGIIFDDGNFKEYVSKGHSRTINIDKRVSGRGNKV